MKNLISTFILAMVFIMTSQTSQANSDVKVDPKVVVSAATGRIVEFLKSNQDKIKQDESLTEALVKKELVPLIDEEGLARRVLGSYWKESSSEQQAMFSAKFMDIVINTFAKSLAQYSGQTFEFEDSIVKGNKALLKSKMLQPAGEPVQIDFYFSVPKSVGDWRIGDVKIEGVSMVKNYNSQYEMIIKKDGLASFFTQLENNQITVK